MGTLTAGIKEIFSSAKTTGSNVMLCGNDGTPDGHMTMANLANVLGVCPFKNLTSSVNLEDLGSGIFTSSTTVVGRPEELGSVALLIIRCKYVGDNYATILIDIERGSGGYMRRMSSANWVKIF